MVQSKHIFDGLSDAIRRRLLALLYVHGELCVCELVVALDMLQPKISRHLAVLREAGIVSVRRDGTWIYYRLDSLLPLWAYRIIEIAVRDAAEAETGADHTRLAQMKDRPVRCAA